MASQPLELDQAFYQRLTAQLSSSDQELFGDLVRNVRPVTIDSLITALDPRQIRVEANQLYSRSRRWQAASTHTLPEAEPAATHDPRPLVHSVG